MLHAFLQQQQQLQTVQTQSHQQQQEKEKEQQQGQVRQQQDTAANHLGGSDASRGASPAAGTAGGGARGNPSPFTSRRPSGGLPHRGAAAAAAGGGGGLPEGTCCPIWERSDCLKPLFQIEPIKVASAEFVL